MLLLLLEYLWDVCATLTFLLYPLLVYRRVVRRKKFEVFLFLCLFFYESQWSNTIYYALVWQFNYWLVYEMKLIQEPYAIAIYSFYRVTQFIITSYGGYVVYCIYLSVFFLAGYYSFKNRERLGEMTKEWNLSEMKSRAVTFLLGKLIQTKKESGGTVI